jgi:hypothetical protein
MSFDYGSVPSKFIVEEDQFLFCATHQIGYGRWDEIKSVIVRARARAHCRV